VEALGMGFYALGQGFWVHDPFILNALPSTAGVLIL
jgi:hypothetical protein